MAGIRNNDLSSTQSKPKKLAEITNSASFNKKYEVEEIEICGITDESETLYLNLRNEPCKFVYGSENEEFGEFGSSDFLNFSDELLSDDFLC